MDERNHFWPEFKTKSVLRYVLCASPTSQTAPYLSTYLTVFNGHVQMWSSLRPKLFCSTMLSKWKISRMFSDWICSPFWSRGLSRALGRTGSGQDPVDAHESDEHYGAGLSNNWRLFWLSLEIGRYGLKHELAEQMPLGLGPRVPERNMDRKCECSL